MLVEKIDHLILGCTHYPYLIPQIKKIIGSDIKIIDSGYAVSKQIFRVLQKNKLLNTQDKTGNYQFYSNTRTEILASILKRNDIPFQIKKIDF
jgi:glutamate racemase